MPTKRQLVEQVTQSIIAGDITAKEKDFVSPQRMQYFIGTALEDVYKVTFIKDPKELDFYAKRFTVRVQWDRRNDTYFCLLPKHVIQFDNMAGIRRVGTERENFDQTDIQELDSIRGSMIKDLKKKISYYYTDNKIKFAFFDPLRQIVEVDIDAVIPFDQYEEDDWIVMPSGKGIDIINAVKQMMIQRLPESKQNDNSYIPNTGK
jgi:hypothetical protein